MGNLNKRTSESDYDEFAAKLRQDVEEIFKKRVGGEIRSVIDEIGDLDEETRNALYAFAPFFNGCQLRGEGGGSKKQPLGGKILEFPQRHLAPDDIAKGSGGGNGKLFPHGFPLYIFPKDTEIPLYRFSLISEENSRVDAGLANSLMDSWEILRDTAIEERARKRNFVEYIFSEGGLYVELAIKNWLKRTALVERFRFDAHTDEYYQRIISKANRGENLEYLLRDLNNPQELIKSGPEEIERFRFMNEEVSRGDLTYSLGRGVDGSRAVPAPELLDVTHGFLKVYEGLDQEEQTELVDHLERALRIYGLPSNDLARVHELSREAGEDSRSLLRFRIKDIKPEEGDIVLTLEDNVGDESTSMVYTPRILGEEFYANQSIEVFERRKTGGRELVDLPSLEGDRSNVVLLYPAFDESGNPRDPETIRHQSPLGDLRIPCLVRGELALEVYSTPLSRVEVHSGKYHLSISSSDGEVIRSEIKRFVDSYRRSIRIQGGPLRDRAQYLLNENLRRRRELNKLIDEEF